MARMTRYNNLKEIRYLCYEIMGIKKNVLRFESEKGKHDVGALWTEKNNKKRYDLYHR